jgi:hypothetical protein
MQIKVVKQPVIILALADGLCSNGGIQDIFWFYFVTEE